MTHARLHHLLCALIAATSFGGSTAAWGGPKAYVGNFKDNTVSVVDTDAATVLATLPVAAGPHGMAMTPDGRRLYVSGDGSSQLSVIDTTTDRVLAPVDVGKIPHGLAMLPDGKQVLVGVYGEDRVVWVDTASGAVTHSVAVPKPHTLAVRPDGALAYVASQEPGKFALVVIDLATRSVARSLPLERPPRDLEFAFDGRALYFTMAGVNAVQVLDPANDRIAAQIPTGASPHLATLFRGAPSGTVVVQGPGEVLLFDPATHAPRGAVAVGKQPHWIAAAGDGRHVLVTNEGSDDLSIVDLDSRSARTLHVGHAPRKVAVQPAAAPSSPAKVSINNFSFTPATVQVRAGEAVTWANDDGAPHGIRYADGSPGQELLLPQQRFTRAFARAGTYDYVCSVHPYMSGKVIVQP